MRVVLDTNILISATQWTGSVAQRVLRQLHESQAELFVSTPILEEFNEVLQRDFDYSDEEAGFIIGRVLELVHVTQARSALRVVTDDPDDDKIIDCAVDCNADVILTYDRHLLKIGQYENIRIIRPEIFAKEE